MESILDYITPGFWEVRERKDGLVNIYVGGTNHDIALCVKPENGKAIASVPDMVEALERIANHEYRSDRRHRGMVDEDEIQALIRIARIAISSTKFYKEKK